MNTTTAPAAVSASAPAATHTPGGLRRAGLVARLARDRVALTSAIVLGLIVLAAMFAPWVAPYDMAPHIATIPSLAIFAIVLTANLLGDAVRDVLDPRLQQ